MHRHHLHDAANGIISEVIDELRSRHYGITFEEYAEFLGFKTLDNRDADIDADAPFRELFVEACKSPTTKDATFKGRGWVAFDPFGDSQLAEAWRACGGRDTSASAQSLTGKQWAKLLNIAGVEFDAFFPKGRKIAIRFRIGNPRSPQLRVGVEVVPDDHELRDRIAPLATTANTIPFSIPATDGSREAGRKVAGTTAGT